MSRGVQPIANVHSQSSARSSGPLGLWLDLRARLGAEAQMQFSNKEVCMKPEDEDESVKAISRRTALTICAAAAAVPLLPPFAAIAQSTVNPSPPDQGAGAMTFVTTKDGTQIFYKDWGPKNAQPLVFHHGWPLSADEWDAQMLFCLAQGFRVAAHDRRGHGRLTQASDGHDMDHNATDTLAVAEHLNLKNAVHIGHSTGGGEVARYVAR